MDANAASPTAPPSTPPIPSPRKSSNKALEPRTPTGRRSRNKQPQRDPIDLLPSDLPSLDLPTPTTTTAAAAAAAPPASAPLPRQHAHNTSWNSTTRDSVVDNLLFSLDNLSRQDVADVDAQEDEERSRYLSSLASQFTMNRPSSRSRGHTHSSSTSDCDRHVADSPQSKLSHPSKGRRSNSSSHFPIHHTLAGRVKSGARALSGSLGRSSSEIQRHSNAPSHPVPQSSDGSTVDHAYGAVLEPSRLTLGAKSLSMDHIHAEGAADGPSVLDRGRSVLSIHGKFDANPVNDFDAAPEPFIAAGPRKMQNPNAIGPVYVNAASTKNKPSTLRKTTTQTDLRTPAAASALPSPPIPQGIRDQAADFVRTSSFRGTVSPPSAHDEAAPSPGITRRREPSPPRESKPGFFKRVFGGASSRAVSTPVERPRSNQVSSPESNDRFHAPDRSVSQASEGDAARPTTDSARPPPTPTLNKKPSSFFRRRKKSTSDALPPLPLSVTAKTNLAIKQAEPSPSISSLRKVMDPYLAQESQGANGLGVPKPNDASRPNTSDSRTEDSDNPDIFHSGYTPPPDASLGNRLPLARELSRPNTAQDNEGLRMKIKKRRPDALNTHDLTDSIYVSEPSRQPSLATLQDRGFDQPKVSPLSDVHPNISRSHTPLSRTSTGEGLIAALEKSPPMLEPEAVRDFSAGTNVSLDMNDEGWLVTNPVPERPISSKKSERLFLQPTSSEERLNAGSGNLSPIEGALSSPTLMAEGATLDRPAHPPPEKLHSSSSLIPPTVQLENVDVSRKSSEPTVSPLPVEDLDDGAEYRERARKIFEGDEEDVSKNEAASWMGERNTLSTRTLQAYMQLFEFSGLNVLATLRILCQRLILRGETQQFDRIITALSARWCECNPTHGFKAQDVVHTIFYSLILLNTDLHLADIGEKMSRSAYVKNTLPTIRRVVADAAPHAFDETLRPSTVQYRPTLPWSSSNISMPTSPLGPFPRDDTPVERPESSMAELNSTKRLSIRPGVLRTDSDNLQDSASVLVNFPWNGSMRGWEMEIEAALKAFFTSIRNEPLPLHGAVLSELPTSNRNLSVVDLNNNLKRTGSIVSRAPSDNMSFRSKQDFRTMTSRWQTRNNRSKPKLYPASTIGSSRTSFDDGSGFWSPAESGKYSFSKTLTSASVGSFNHFSPVDSLKHSIGFANALSQAIIREENLSGDGSDTFSMPGGLLDDESLTLEGAPWAKEGMVKHKHHKEAGDKKAKDRNWTECFAVISKGKLTLFAFGTSSSSSSNSKTQSFGRKNHFMKSGKAASVTGATVGGGDWMENAEQLEVFVLRQTIASTLPPPGYGKNRPHVWALSLPSGAVHLFQVGTPDIAGEFMSTANYWSARLSKEPLAGGVSNIEYGWSENIINPALLDRSESFQHPPSSMSNHRPMGSISTTDRGRRSSLQSSMRSSFDTGFGGPKAKLPGDKAQLTEWQPPTQSMMASQLMDVDQLKQLNAYVRSQEVELEKHNELKHAIELAFSPRHPNFTKVMGNWQRKSDYLLREIVKFNMYIDSLVAAQKAKDAFYAKKAEGRLSPVTKGDNDDLHDLPTISNNMMSDVAPRGIHTSG